MFAVRLLLVFFLIPAALVILATLMPSQMRSWLLFAVFPIALIAFSVLCFAAEGRESAMPRDGGER